VVFCKIEGDIGGMKLKILMNWRWAHKSKHWIWRLIRTFRLG